MSEGELRAWLLEVGESSWRAKQILEWVFDKGVNQWDEMTNLSLPLREKLSQSFALRALTLVKTSDSGDGQTFKYLWRMGDQKLVESVLICSEERRTVCVSSQVGCAARCAFCASGKKGLFRNLEAGEIVEQVLQLRSLGERVSHIVFMGMGEPLDNVDNVIQAVRILNEKVGLGKRRITVSTVGVVEGIERLTAEGLGVNLVLSLHAPNQHLRKKIIPYARQYPLEEVLDAMERFSQSSGRDVTYEYILISGINDGVAEAQELATLLKGRQCTVNLIPYNPVAGINFRRPSGTSVAHFREILDQQGIINTCRYTKGDDIAAACGQLALQESE
ncbi:MAG: 23S rRNA (adenine(2503)-C(2))-methyltransferase RlmN [Verrucomicrobia bacterium]|nr:23S rRNA (adenine(2503)-C(2))-methyltransferase RlmN [Verrucomicrobiota bacterium]